jgi:hypothetical protein
MPPPAEPPPATGAAPQGSPTQSEIAGNGHSSASGRWVRQDGKIIVHGA